MAPQDGHADPILEEIMRYQVDGLILASTSLSSALAAECREAGIPVVLFNRKTSRDAAESVTGDNLAGGRQIAQFLVAGGHRRFAFVAGVENSSTNRDRERGFREGLAAHGFTDLHRVVGRYDWTAASRAADELFSRRPPPDAVFCASDHMAIAVMETAREKHGLRIPEDVSIVGFDDAGPAAWPSFSLTTYSQPVDGMVEAAVELFESRLADPTRPLRQVIVPGDLVVRSSARLPQRGLATVDGRRLWRSEADPSAKGPVP
jgi:DNA-binding LacI/PurR family transcriptional regulator